MNRWIAVIGHVFITAVSVIAAFRMDEMLIKVLLVLSALVSLIFAIIRLLRNKRMEEKIKKLEEGKQDKLVFASKETCKSIIDELT